MGRTLGFFESVPFFRMGSRPWALVGSIVLSGVCVFKGGLSTPIRVSLIVVPDKIRTPHLANPTIKPRCYSGRGGGFYPQSNTS